jgi:hypothetical protein
VKWAVSDRFDPRALPLADRHYNRRKVGSNQFVPPGRCLVLLTPDADALWVTSAPFAEYVRHEWAGAWVCTLFRREPACPHLASELIAEAVAATLWRFGPPPPQGFVTFVDRSKTRSKRDPGYCYLKAGWRNIGRTKGGLYALGLTQQELVAVEPCAPLGAQLGLLG